jgi:hypothetical protein
VLASIALSVPGLRPRPAIDLAAHQRVGDDDIVLHA